MTSASSSKPARAVVWPAVPYGVLFALGVLALNSVIVPWLLQSALYAVGVVSSPAGQALRGLITGYQTEAILVYAVLTAAVTVTVIAVALRRLYGVGLSGIGLQGFRPWLGFAYIALGLFAFYLVLPAVMNLLSQLVPGFQATAPQTTSYDTAGRSLNPATVAGLVVVPPIIEEIIFRGVAFAGFARRVGPVWGAIIVSLVFGAAHLGVSNGAFTGFNVMAYTACLSLILCYVDTKLKSIIPGIVIHGANNLIALLATTVLK